MMPGGCVKGPQTACALCGKIVCSCWRTQRMKCEGCGCYACVCEQSTPVDSEEKSCDVALDPKIGIGGAPTRATTFPKTAEGRKATPVASGVLDYFPDALIAVAQVSYAGSQQHHPGEPLHWARGKSSDESDALARHFLQRGTIDDDGLRHSAKLAWRALALLQKEIESER